MQSTTQVVHLKYIPEERKFVPPMQWLSDRITRATKKWTQRITTAVAVFAIGMGIGFGTAGIQATAVYAAVSANNVVCTQGQANAF